MPKRPIAERIVNNIIRLDEGQERYAPDTGTIPEGTIILCGLCGDKCTESRGQYGPRSFVMAMSGSKSVYDEWWCPNHEQKWHKQAEKLFSDAKSSHSARIEAIIRKELSEILKNRKTTK